MLELLDATVEFAPAGVEPTNPLVDRLLPGGFAHLSADRRRALLRVPGVATFAVVDGAHVALDPAPAVAEEALWMWLRGTVAALLLAQRGRFALHASVVDVDGVGVAVAGPRGAGKSTTALRLTQLGRPLVTDDVTPLLMDRRVTVEPYNRPVHAFADTACILGVDVSQARPVLPGHAKLAVPAPRGEPVDLGGIAVLEPAGRRNAVEVERISGARAHWLVALNVYRGDILRELWESELFAWATRVAADVPVHLVTRPPGSWTVDAVARAVESLGVSSSRSAP